MKSRLFSFLLIFTGLLLAGKVSATIAFTTLSPDGFYDNTSASAINGASYINGYQAHADQFFPATSGVVTSIELGLHYSVFSSPPGDQVDVRLALDLDDPVHGHLPSSTNLAAGTLTLTTDFGSFGLLTFTPSTVVLLTAGTPYWVVVSPHFTNTVGFWNINNIGKTGPIAASFNGVTWGQNPSALMDAFRVNVGPVPEPSSLCLAAIAFGILLSMRRGSL